MQKHMLFSKDTSTYKRYKCARGAKNIHDELTSNVLGMLRNAKRLTMMYIVKLLDMEMRKRTKYDM